MEFSGDGCVDLVGIGMRPWVMVVGVAAEPGSLAEFVGSEPGEHLLAASRGARFESRRFHHRASTRVCWHVVDRKAGVPASRACERWNICGGDRRRAP